MTEVQLENLYSQINEYIFSHFEFFWAIILGIFGIIGVALFFIAKSMIANGIEKEAEKQHRNYTNLESQISQIRLASLRFHPTEYALPLCDIAKSAGKCCYSKNSDDLVIVTFFIKPCDGEFSPGMQKIAMLPDGFRPESTISQTISESLSFVIGKNGDILYDATTAHRQLSCASIFFYAA